MADYIIATTELEYTAAGSLFKEYAGWLNIDLSFQHFDEEILALKTMYSSPNGAIILCNTENKYIACVAVRKIDEQIAELKRMFVRKDYQRQGIGKVLLNNVIGLAKSYGYNYIRLDTLSYMTPAINLYKQNGFYEIEPYYHNPNQTAVYFERKI